MSFASLTLQRPVELLDDELRVEHQVDLARRPSSRAISSARMTPVYSAYVVGLDAQGRRSTASGRRVGIARVRPRAASMSTAPGRGRTGVAARRAVGADDQARVRPGAPRSRQARSPLHDRRASTSRIAWVMLMPRGQASVQLKIVRQRHTPSSSARISSRSCARVVARVEDEAVGVDDRRRPDVRRPAPRTTGTRWCRRRTGCTWWCRRSARGPRLTGAARARAAASSLIRYGMTRGTWRRSRPCRRRGP